MLPKRARQKQRRKAKRALASLNRAQKTESVQTPPLPIHSKIPVCCESHGVAPDTWPCQLQINGQVNMYSYLEDQKKFYEVGYCIKPHLLEPEATETLRRASINAASWWQMHVAKGKKIISGEVNMSYIIESEADLK